MAGKNNFVLGVLVVLLACLAFVLPPAAANYCDEVQAANDTTCHTCVEITLLGGRPNCAYCANPYSGQVHCAEPFYPPAAQVPGLTVYACFRDTNRTVNRYVPRCSASDCYIDQCTFSGRVLWYIVVPSVVGFVLLVGGGYLCWCCHKRQQKATKKWIEKENAAERKAAGKRAEKSRERNKERKAKTDELRRKYGLLEDDDDDDERGSKL